jgi:hypothetical protein
MIPDLTGLTKAQRKELLSSFDKLRELSFPSLLEQLKSSFAGRRELDRRWLSIFGIYGERCEKIINQLHKHLYETLSDLLRAMEKD